MTSIMKQPGNEQVGAVLAAETCQLTHAIRDGSDMHDMGLGMVAAICGKPEGSFHVHQHAE